MPAADTLPLGFRRSLGGLILPDEQSRVREVWTKDEWRLLDRATRLLKSRALAHFLQCTNPACKGAPVEKVSTTNGFELRCEHAARVFQKAF